MSKQVKKFVFDAIGDNYFFDFHIQRSVFYARKLAKKYKVNLQQAEIGALLHDIDGIVDGRKNDFEYSEQIARELLEKEGYSEKFIVEIQSAIVSHSSGSKVKPKTMLEKIVANADGLAHLEMLPLYFYAHGERGGDFQDSVKMVRDKLDRSWSKMTLPEAKKLGKELRKHATKILAVYK